MTNKKLKINLFGESWKLKQILLSDDFLGQFNDVAKKLNQPLPHLLSDPFFYYLLKNKAIQSVEDLPGIVTEGLLDSPKNQIEIWYDRKKVQKLKINDLKNELLLFPLFNTTKRDFEFESDKGLYFEQKEIGLVASYEFLTNSFVVDNLEFQLLNTKSNSILNKLIYKKHELVSIKKDTLVISQNSFEID